MSISTKRRPCLFLLFAALFLMGKTGMAQSADQSLKSIPQTVKSNAEAKANNKANAIGNSATDKIDSGMNKAYKGFVGLFRKKNKTVGGGGTPPPPGMVNPGGTPPPPGMDTTHKNR